MKHCWFKYSHCPRLPSWVAGPTVARRRGSGGVCRMWAKHKLRCLISLFFGGGMVSTSSRVTSSLPDFLKMCLHVWIQYVSANPDGGFPAGLVATVGWMLKKTTLRFGFFFSFSLFTVSFELTTGSLILLLLLLLYFIQMFYWYFRYNSALSGKPKSLCVCICSKLCADNHGHVELYTINPVLTSNGHFCELQTVSNIS